MSEASGSKKLISLICLIGGAVLIVAALALDFMARRQVSEVRFLSLACSASL